MRRRRFEGQTRGAWLRTILHALPVASFALILLLQSVVVGMTSTPARASRSGVAAGERLVSKLCASGKTGGAPHSDHSEACAICCGAREWTSPRPRDDTSDATSRPTTARCERARARTRSQSPSVQSGWESSWSSRAPPSRS